MTTTIGHDERRRLMFADAFLRTEHEAPPAIWGEGQQVLWPAGEPLLICANAGVGKTTLAQQVCLALLRGAEEPEKVLGYPVLPEDRNVLYVAADRPRQAARSLKRMVRASDKAMLASRLYVWDGDFKLDDIPEVAERLLVGTVFVDTLGAVVPDVSSEESGLAIYHSLKRAVRAGVEVCLMHHNRKRGDNFRGLDEVYGSQWITAGAGSVLMLRGESGDKQIKLRQVKVPAEALSFDVEHDHLNGVSHRV